MLPRTGLLTHRHVALLAILSAIALTPFVVIHFRTGELTALAIAIAGIVLLAGLFGWILHSRANALPSLILVCGASGLVLFSLWAQGINGAFWTYPVVLVGYLLFARRPAVILNIVFYALVILIGFHVLPVDHYARILVTLAMVSVFAYVFANAVEDGMHRLDRLAQVDPLTGLWNRRHLHKRLPEPAHALGRDGITSSLAVLDIDNFKDINDTHGHARGDEILSKISGLMKNRTRERDHLFRYGGEEFVLILPNTSEANATGLCNELRESIGKMEFADDLQVTISAGVAELRPDEQVEAWLARADIALLQAKRDGRNRVVAASTLPDLADCDSMSD